MMDQYQAAAFLDLFFDATLRQRGRPLSSQERAAQELEIAARAARVSRPRRFRLRRASEV
jgi:hypothetical protein